MTEKYCVLCSPYDCSCFWICFGEDAGITLLSLIEDAPMELPTLYENYGLFD